ncbi:hypothetical protein F5Y10DRAFT_268684 [Nemania abortiva]|nr:hypothetical protein F5Y10DRAFT_268684 [Nemania abortiva]
MEPASPAERTALAIRCYGHGQRTSRHRSAVDIALHANVAAADDDDPAPREIDEHRGVLEFRQMGQSLDAEAIMAWTHVCGKVVSAARESNPVAFRELVAMATTTTTRSPEVSLWGLLDITNANVMAPFGPEDRDEEGFYSSRKDRLPLYSYPFHVKPAEYGGYGPK